MLNEFPILTEDIQLIPNKCVLKSRVEADTHVTWLMKLPVVPSNMQTILDEDVADNTKGGYFYVYPSMKLDTPFVKRMPWGKG